MIDVLKLRKFCSRYSGAEISFAVFRLVLLYLLLQERALRVVQPLLQGLR